MTLRRSAPTPGYAWASRPVPDILSGTDWDIPMIDRDSDSIFLIVEYLKIMDPENADEPHAYPIAKELADQHMEFYLQVERDLSGIPGFKEHRNRTYRRITFQRRQYQIAVLFKEALEKANGNYMKLHGMMRYHRPGIAPAWANNAVMKMTVTEALKTLGRDHSPAAVEKLWLELNQEVDLLTNTARVRRMVWWADNRREIPHSGEEMKRIFLQDQNEAAWMVIDQHLTEPINALMEQQEEEDSWTVDWD